MRRFYENTTSYEGLQMDVGTSGGPGMNPPDTAEWL